MIFVRLKYLVMRIMASLGGSAAQNFLGFCHEEGMGRPVDLATALKWYTLAAEQGDVHALSNLGRMYEQGIGLTVDLKRALRFYERAASRGHAWSQNRLATHLLEMPCAEMRERGIFWLKRAITMSDAPYAKLNLAWAYSEGLGVAKDAAKAHRIVRDLAEEGVPEAKLVLGRLMRSDTGPEESEQ